MALGIHHRRAAVDRKPLPPAVGMSDTDDHILLRFAGAEGHCGRVAVLSQRRPVILHDRPRLRFPILLEEVAANAVEQGGDLLVECRDPAVALNQQDPFGQRGNDHALTLFAGDQRVFSALTGGDVNVHAGEERGTHLGRQPEYRGQAGARAAIAHSERKFLRAELATVSLLVAQDLHEGGGLLWGEDQQVQGASDRVLGGPAEHALRGAIPEDHPSRLIVPLYRHVGRFVDTGAQAFLTGSQ